MPLATHTSGCPTRPRCVEVLRSTQHLAHAGLQLDTVLCARHARLFLASSTTLTRARVKLPCQIVGTLWLSTTTALPSSCPLLSARPPNRLHPWSSRLVGPQPPRGRPAALLTSVGSVFPADTVSTPQSLLYSTSAPASRMRRHGVTLAQPQRDTNCHPMW